MRRPLAILSLLFAAAPGFAAVPECARDATENRIASSVGDAAMAPVMDRLLAAYHAANPGSAAPVQWAHKTDAVAAGSLMFELADMAAMTRAFAPAETAPYDHQFKGDMMKTPLMVQVASRSGAPAWIAVNKRPDAPLPPRVAAFLGFALSEAGQAAIAAVPGFAGLDAAARQAEARKLGAYLAPLDPDLGRYRLPGGITGEIRSVGSDGMKSLMDSWMCRLSAAAPGVSRGERWEHLGTLNGFHALLTGEADIAPMGRELWPQELAQWQAAFGQSAPVEIAVARGGFNTPQRTTAQVIFVHPDNPLTSITIDQLRGILGANPTITRWGQMGLTGDWANRPIALRTPPLAAPNAMSMQIQVLKGGAWNAAAKAAPYADTARAILEDRTAIGFGGLEEGAPGLKPLAVAGADGTPIAPTSETAANGRYPLTRYMYIRLAPGAPSRQTAALLRFILSADGQERVRYSGYHPLTAEEARRELAKLDRLATR